MIETDHSFVIDAPIDEADDSTLDQPDQTSVLLPHGAHQHDRRPPPPRNQCEYHRGEKVGVKGVIDRGSGFIELPLVGIEESEELSKGLVCYPDVGMSFFQIMFLKERHAESGDRA